MTWEIRPCEFLSGKKGNYKCNAKHLWQCEKERGQRRVSKYCHTAEVRLKEHM